MIFLCKLHREILNVDVKIHDFQFDHLQVSYHLHILPFQSAHGGYSTTKYEGQTPSGSGRTRHRFFCIGVEFVKGFHYKGTSLGFPSFECIGELENQCRDLQHEIRYHCSAFCMSMCTPESVQNLNFEVI